MKYLYCNRFLIYGIIQMLVLITFVQSIDHLPRPQTEEQYKRKDDHLNAKRQVRKFLQPTPPNAVWDGSDIV